MWYAYTCKVCGKKGDSRKPNKETCSGRCRTIAWRQHVADQVKRIGNIRRRDEQAAKIEPKTPEQPKRGRGRPKGSKNKPKTQNAS